MNKKKIIPFVLIVILAIAVAVVLRSRKGFSYAGTIEATEVTLSARVSGVIDTIAADEGDEVRADQELVRIKTEDLDIALGEYEKEYARARQLVESGSMNQDAYDKIKFRRDDTRVRKNWGMIRSPFAGTLITRYHEPGELVTPGTKLMTLADLKTVWAYVYVPQPLLTKISLGMTVTATVPETPGKQITGTIIKINSEAEFTPKNVQTSAERTRLVYGVKLQFPNADRFLKPGMVVEAVLPEK